MDDKPIAIEFDSKVEGDGIVAYVFGRYNSGYYAVTVKTGAPRGSTMQYCAKHKRIFGMIEVCPECGESVVE